MSSKKRARKKQKSSTFSKRALKNSQSMEFLLDTTRLPGLPDSCVDELFSKKRLRKFEALDDGVELPSDFCARAQKVHRAYYEVVDALRGLQRAIDDVDGCLDQVNEKK